MEKKYVVGVDLGGTKIYTALVDLDGNIIKIKKRKIPFAVHVAIYYNRKKHQKII